MFLNHQISYSHPFDTFQPRKRICTQLSFVQADDLSFDRSHGNPLCKGFLEHEEDRNDWHLGKLLYAQHLLDPILCRLR